MWYCGECDRQSVNRMFTASLCLGFSHDFSSQHLTGNAASRASGRPDLLSEEFSNVRDDLFRIEAKRPVVDATDAPILIYERNHLGVRD